MELSRTSKLSVHKPSDLINQADLIFTGCHSFAPQENVAVNNAVHFNVVAIAWGYICIILRQYTAEYVWFQLDI